MRRKMENQTNVITDTRGNPHKGHYYEAIFLNNDEITSLFEEMRDFVPFKHLTKDFHVTTAFMPESMKTEYYGKTLDIHITAYKIGEVKADDGSLTSNEGFKVEVRSEEAEI